MKNIFYNRKIRERSKPTYIKLGQDVKRIMSCPNLSMQCHLDDETGERVPAIRAISFGRGDATVSNSPVCGRRRESHAAWRA